MKNEQVEKIECGTGEYYDDEGLGRVIVQFLRTARRSVCKQVVARMNAEGGKRDKLGKLTNGGNDKVKCFLSLGSSSLRHIMWVTRCLLPKGITALTTESGLRKITNWQREWKKDDL